MGSIGSIGSFCVWSDQWDQQLRSSLIYQNCGQEMWRYWQQLLQMGTGRRLREFLRHLAVCVSQHGISGMPKNRNPQNWQSQKKTWESTMGVWATRSLGRTIFTSLIIDHCAQWSLNTQEAGWSAKEPTFVYWIDGLEYHTGTFNQEDQTKDQVGGTFSQPFWCLPVD